MSELPANSALIVPRRNFLVRALGFTAAGATLAVPIVEMATPEQRLEHHLQGLEKAMHEVFPDAVVTVAGNCRQPRDQAYYREGLSDPIHDGSLHACLMVTAANPHPALNRETFLKRDRERNPGWYGSV